MKKLLNNLLTFPLVIFIALMILSQIVISKSHPFEHTIIKNVVFKTQFIENEDIDESSGLALSRKYDNVLWTHNDSGSAAVIYAMDYKGLNLGSYFLEGKDPRDWEDMASFELNGQSYIIVADTGDNFEIFLSAKLSIYKEPDIFINNNLANNGVVEKPQWIIEFQYPKGKTYDVESLAVDVKNNKILLLSKRNKKIRVFELPLKPNEADSNLVLTAKRMAKLDYLKKPTSMDISGDGKYAVILSYGKVYWFNKMDGNSWKKTLRKPDKIIEYEGLYQPEGISFGKTPYQLFISSENLPAKLLKIDF